MQIYFERHGGFAGMRVQTTLDTEDLPPQKADPLKEMIYGSNFFDLPQSLNAAPSGPDMFHYRLTVTDGERSHTVEMNASTDTRKLATAYPRIRHDRKNPRRS